MRLIIFIAVLLCAQNSLAHTDTNFQAFMKRQAKQVNSGSEGFLKAQIIHQESGGELSEAVSVATKQFGLGLSRINMEPIGDENPQYKVMSKLLDNYTPFFCGALTVDGEWSEDKKLCRKNLEKLFGNVFQRVKNNRRIGVFVMEATGDYYGDWQETVVFIINYVTDETLIIHFDIFHEV